jgi:hypothetical protein
VMALLGRLERTLLRIHLDESFARRLTLQFTVHRDTQNHHTRAQ